VYWADRECTNLVEEASPMKREVEFAENFALSVLLLAGSFAVAQSATTAKKAGPTTAAVAGNSGQGARDPQTTQAPAAGDAIVPSATTQNQPSATTTKPKTIVSADKRTIPVPQL
jgi:hypothetical protein